MDFDRENLASPLAREEDPFAFFPTLAPQSNGWTRFTIGSQRILHRFIAPYRWPLLLLAALIGIFAVMAGREEAKPPFVFVEIRAIDPSGHPVAGARVEVGKDLRGVTDSFGEWRRYVRLKPGSEIAVRLLKNTRAGMMHAAKKLNVPVKVPKNKEPEIKSSIQLSIRGVKARRVQARKTSAAIEAERLPAAASDTGDFSKIAVSVKLPASDTSHPTHKVNRTQLEKHIYPLLRKRLTQSGLKVDPASSWQVTLQYLPFPDQRGVVRAQVSFVQDGRMKRESFLRHLSDRPEKTVSDLVSLIKQHTPKTYKAFPQNGGWYIAQTKSMPAFWALRGGEVLKDIKNEGFPVSNEIIRPGEERFRLITADQKPCGQQRDHADGCILVNPTVTTTPPVAGWRMLQFKVMGNIPRGAEIFLSGYRARPVGTGLWEYWGEPFTGANVTVVSHSRVILRQRIQDSDRAIPALSLSAPAIARR